MPRLLGSPCHRGATEWERHRSETLENGRGTKMIELAEKFAQAIKAIDGWDGSNTTELEGLVDAAEEAAYDASWDDDDELDESAYSSMCDEIHQAAGSTGSDYPDFPDWPTLIAAGKDGLLLVLSETEPGERMSVYVEANPDFTEENEAA